MTIYRFFQLLVGHSGRYLQGLWTPDNVLANLLWSANINYPRTIATQIINGYRQLPAKYATPYRGSNGLELLEEDLRAFVAHYHSDAMLLDIYARMHADVVTSSLSPEQINSLAGYYIEKNPSRDDIATYLAHVLHCILCS